MTLEDFLINSYSARIGKINGNPLADFAVAMTDDSGLRAQAVSKQASLAWTRTQPCKCFVSGVHRQALDQVLSVNA